MNAPSHTQQRTAIGIFGKQGSGKTALEKQIIRNYVAKGGKVIVLDRQNQFPGYSVWPGLDHVEEYIQTKILNKHTGLFIMDDADIFMTSRSKQVIRDMIASFRHYGLDIVVSAKMPQSIDVTLLGCLDIACIFRMPSPHGRAHLEEWLGDDFPDLMHNIPKDKYEFVECNINTEEMCLRETSPM